ncbi:MAG: hypothetical protein AAGD38_19245, partial [Acidobacteriota bacterium]
MHPSRPLLSIIFLALVALALTGCFPTQAGSSLRHFADEAPAIGAPAPTLEVTDLDGHPVPRDMLLRGRPIVLQFGSHTCPVYRYRR